MPIQQSLLHRAWTLTPEGCFVQSCQTPLVLIKPSKVRTQGLKLRLQILLDYIHTDSYPFLKQKEIFTKGFECKVTLLHLFY